MHHYNCERCIFTTATMKKFNIILLLIFCQLAVSAQRYSFYNLGVENGLIQSQVRAMTQDSYGHLWIGTLGGLSRYDGDNVTNYNVRNGMLDNNCTAITTDEQGNLWIGGTEGLSVYDGKEFKHFRMQSPDNSGGSAVRNIARGSNNKLWCYTDKEVYSIRDKQIKQLKLPDSNLTVSALYPEKDTIWVASRDGRIFKYHGKTWDTIYFNFPGQQHLPISTTGFLRDHKGRLLISTLTGLFSIRNDSIKLVSSNGQPIVNIPFTTIAEDINGAIWLGGISGAYRVTDSLVVKYDKKNGLTDNAIQTILTDKEGSVWLGSDGQGLFRYSGGEFAVLDERSNLTGEQVMSFAPTPSGKLYIGTADAGLFYYDNSNIIPIPLQQKNLYISALHADSEYDIWVGTSTNGLHRLKGKEKIYYNIPELPANTTILSLCKDTSGRLLIGTGTGLVIYSDNKFTRPAGLPSSIFSAVVIGRDSVILATAKGLYLYQNSGFTPFITGTATDSSNAQCLTFLDNKLWIGTNDNGVLCYNLKTGKCITINKSNYLKSDFVYNIIADKRKDIWAGTGYGIHKIHFTDNKLQVTFYGKEQGLTGMESNQNAVCMMPDGTMWFGTTKGAVHIDPDRQLILPHPMSVVLQSVKVFGDDVRDTTWYDSLDNWYNVPYNLALPYKKNNVTFTFKGISLNGNEQLEYRYHMKGLEAPWSDWTTLNSVTYSALPPGKYTLEVECRTADTKDIKTLSYDFEIITPLHKTSWFSFMIFIACILAGVTIQYILNKRKQNRLALVEQLRKEEQSKVRQRTAEDFHDEVGNKLTRINVLTTVLKEKLGDVTPDKKRILEQIQENTAQLYSGTKDILWSLQATNDNLYEILHRVRDFGNELFSDTNIEFLFSGTDNEWQNHKLPLDMSRNLIMIFKEALNNALKYADATKVTLNASLTDHNVLHITLADNGKGFNVEEVIKGNGLNNMRNRTERLKGKIYIDSHEGKGTVISLHFRLPGKNS